MNYKAKGCFKEANRETAMKLMKWKIKIKFYFI